MVLSIVTHDKNDKNDKNEIKKQVIYLYVCNPPGLEDYSSRPGIVSRSSVVLSVEGVLSVEREERMMTSVSHQFHFYRIFTPKNVNAIIIHRLIITVYS